MVDQPALCSGEQLNDAHQGRVGVILVQPIFGLGVKLERDVHFDHQGAPENPQSRVWARLRSC